MEASSPGNGHLKAKQNGRGFSNGFLNERAGIPVEIMDERQFLIGFTLRGGFSFAKLVRTVDNSLRRFA